MSDLTRQSLETIEQQQNEKLRAMLDLCARGHPYYRQLWAEAKIDVHDIRSLADLERLPLTHKSESDGGPRAFSPVPSRPPAAGTSIVGDHLHDRQHRRSDADLQHHARL